MNTNCISRNKKFGFLLMVLMLPFCSGCYLEDLVMGIINEFFPEEETVEIIIVPPYPMSSDSSVMDDVQSFINAKDVAEGLATGVAEFNRVSTRTTIVPCWCQEPDFIRGFYEKYMVNEARKAKENNVPFSLEKFARDFLRILRQDDDSVHCLIFGHIDYRPDATAYMTTFYYYDYITGNIASERAVITKTPGRAREEAVSELLQTLLEKVYDR